MAMRILYHHRTLGDGAEGIHVSSMVDALRRLGHDVKVASVIGERTNVSTGRTRALGWVTRCTPRLIYEAMEVGYNLFGARMLLQEAETFKPDLLYERYTLFNMAGLTASRRAGIPMILEVNAPLAYERAAYETLSLKRLARRCERHVCSNAHVVVVVSTPLKEHLVGEGVPAERIVVLPNGADSDVFRPDPEVRAALRAQLAIEPDDVVVGFSGILRPWHGVDVLIEAVAQLRERSRVKVLIVGDGPSVNTLRALSVLRGLERQVIFTGRVAHREIPRYLAAFDIGLSPRATFYASPMKVPEYMATGMAVVAPRMPNLADLIVDGVDGVLFRPDDVDDLTVVLDSLVEDKDRREKLARTARTTILTRRTWLHNAARVVSLVGEGRRACA